MIGPPVRLLLCENHDRLRAAMKAFLASQADMDVVGEAATTDEAIEQMAALRPDVVVIEIDLSGLNGLKVACHIGHQFPECQVLLLTIGSSAFYRSAARKVGAFGCVSKARLDEELVCLIRLAHTSRSSVPLPASR